MKMVFTGMTLNRTIQVAVLSGLGMLWPLMSSLAQQVEFTISPQTIRVGEVATAELKIRGAKHAGVPNLPGQKGLQISSSGKRSETQIVNGKMDRFISYTYSVIPLQPGDYTIGPFTYQADKSQFGIPAVKLKAVAPGGTGQGGNDQQVDWNSLIFSTMETLTPEVYNQQFLDVRLAIYFKSHINLDNQIQPLNLPSAGLVIKEMRSLRSGKEQVNGEEYDVRRFLIKFQAITEGAFTLEPTLRAHILVNRKRRRSNSLFDEFFAGSRYEKHPIDLKPKALELRVKGLPEDGRPENFSGAVGEYAMDVQVSPRNLQAGDPVTLRTTISGQGNIETIVAPNLSLGDGFRVYEAKLITKELNPSGSSGRKVFEQVIIPREAGDIELPPLAFSYFNPALNSFIELKKGKVVLDVKENKQAGNSLVIGQQIQAPSGEITVVDLDIAYLKPLPRSWPQLESSSQTRLLSSPYIHGIPPILIAAVFLMTRRRRQLEGNVLLKRRQQAPRKARAGIQQAHQALAANDPAAYYEAVHRSLVDFYSDRLGWAPGEFDLGRLAQHLQQKAVAAVDIDFLRSLLLHAESVRYGAGLSDDARRQANEENLDRLATILKRGGRS